MNDCPNCRQLDEFSWQFCAVHWLSTAVFGYLHEGMGGAHLYCCDVPMLRRELREGATPRNLRAAVAALPEPRREYARQAVEAACASQS